MNKHSEIRTVGPIKIIEGGIIFKHPFKSHPLNGFKDDSFQNSDNFLNSIKHHADEWFETFPDCCDGHKELKEIPTFKKSDYDYIPNQILNNVLYFAYSINHFIHDENWLDEIKDYYDYLLESLGRPHFGGHIFERSAKYFVENGTIDTYELSDDQRLDLLAYLEPQKIPSDINDRELDVLYLTFQKWLEIMPNIGKFKEFKERFIGKIPMNIFMNQPRYNKYLETYSYYLKSKTELLEFLIKMTNDILKLSNDEIKENYNKEQLLLTAEERLKLQQRNLLEEQSEQEVNYITLIEKWLTITIDYYTVLNDVIDSKEIIENVKLINSNVNDVILSLDDLKTQIISLHKEDKVANWIKGYLSDSSYDKLVESIDKLEDKESDEVLKSIFGNLKSNAKSDISELEYKINAPEISIKHKIKMSIPIFLFTRYETELELSDKQKLPTNIKEFKKYWSFGKK